MNAKIKGVALLLGGEFINKVARITIIKKAMNGMNKNTALVEKKEKLNWIKGCFFHTDESFT